MIGSGILKTLNAFRKDQSGVTAIEYGLIAALVGIAIIGSLSLLGGELNEDYTEVAKEVTDATAAFPGS